MDARKRMALFTASLVLLGSTVLAEEFATQTNDDQETIVERDAAGRIRLEREVALDQNENFVNHGIYNIYDEAGLIVGGGEYAWGQKNGPWKRVYKTQQEAPVLMQFGQGFTGPFVSEANFTDDKLDGVWFVTDKTGRIVFHWEFANGVRHGVSTWFDARGNTRQQIRYDNDQVDSDVISIIGKEQKILQRYIYGRKLVPDVEKFANGRVKRQGHVLMPKEVTRINVDWWNAEAQETFIRKSGEMVRHGEFKFWYANGRPQLTGAYNVGREIDDFVWYYDNGLKQTEGSYTDGLRDGTWSEWYANGAAKGTGVYTDGVRVGPWRSWHENGMRRRDASFQAGEQIGAVRTWDAKGRRLFEEASPEERVAERVEEVEEADF